VKTIINWRLIALKQDAEVKDVKNIVSNTTIQSFDSLRNVTECKFSENRQGCDVTGSTFTSLRDVMITAWVANVAVESMCCCPGIQMALFEIFCSPSIPGYFRG
jgi:hypothetical protein